MTVQRVRSQAAATLTGAEAGLLQSNIRFVEFFGLPGVGKTTVSSLMAARLKLAGFSVQEARAVWDARTLVGRQIHRLGIVLPRLMDRKFRSLVVRIARFVADGGQDSATDLVRVTWNLCTVVAYLVDQRSRGTSITIIDQGLLQGFWSVRLKSRRGRTSEDWLEILSAIGVDDIVFVDLHGEFGLAQNRLQGRGDRSSRMQRASAENETDLWSRAAGAYRDIRADLEKTSQANGCAPILATVGIEASTSPEEGAERALAAVLLACQQRR